MLWSGGGVFWFLGGFLRDCCRGERVFWFVAFVGFFPHLNAHTHTDLSGSVLGEGGDKVVGGSSLYAQPYQFINPYASATICKAFEGGFEKGFNLQISIFYLRHRPSEHQSDHS